MLLKWLRIGDAELRTHLGAHSIAKRRRCIVVIVIVVVDGPIAFVVQWRTTV